MDNTGVSTYKLHLMHIACQCQYVVCMVPIALLYLLLKAEYENSNLDCI